MKRGKRGKKGMIGVQFNWIFILIVGALIIMFFVKVVYHQKVISDRKLSAKVLNELTLLSVGAEVATSTASEVDIGKNPIAFECEECQCEYYMAEFGKTYTVRYVSRALFAPSLVAGQKIMTWALDWNMPFKVTNFLYVTSPEIRYVFVFENDGINKLKQDVIDKLPDQINRGNKNNDFYEINEVDNDPPPTNKGFDYRNEYKVRIVVWDDQVTSDPDTEGIYRNSDKHQHLVNLLSGQLDNMDYEDISLVRIIPQGGQYGRLEFYKAKSDMTDFELDQEPTYYVGEASLIGAILVDNYYNYVCSMDAAMSRLHNEAYIYSERTAQLKTLLSLTQECSVTYDGALVYLSNIIARSGGYFSDSSVSPDWATRVGDLYSNSFGLNSLESQNDKALLFSCPEIF